MAEPAPAPVTTTATPTTTITATAVKPGNGGESWAHRFAEGLPEELTKEWLPTATRYLTPADKIKADIELQKSAVFLPKDDKPESWDKVYAKLGRPAEHKDYKWNHLPDTPQLEESDIAVREGFGQVAHKLGMTQKQLDGALQWNDQQRKVLTDAFVAKANTVADTHVKTLKAELGPDYDRAMGLHRTAVTTYGSKDLDALRTLRLDDGTFALDHPALVRVFSRIGAERSEDSRFAETFNPSGIQDAKAQIDKIEGEAMALGLVPTDPRWPNDKLNALYKVAHGSRGPSR
jgi:hypothetical protein